MTSGGLQLRRDHGHRPPDAIPRGKQSIKSSFRTVVYFDDVQITLMMYKLLLKRHEHSHFYVVNDSEVKKKRLSKVGCKTIVNKESVGVVY